MKRTPLTAREKLALLESQNWNCAYCGEPIGTARVEFDHTIPVALGNEQKANAGLHLGCHKLKTRDDVRRIAKAKRQSRLAAIRTLSREVRKRKLQGRPFPKIRRMLGDLKWKRKINGQTVRRVEQ